MNALRYLNACLYDSFLGKIPGYVIVSVALDDEDNAKYRIKSIVLVKTDNIRDDQCVVKAALWMVGESGGKNVEVLSVKVLNYCRSWDIEVKGASIGWRGSLY